MTTTKRGPVTFALVFVLILGLAACTKSDAKKQQRVIKVPAGCKAIVYKSPPPPGSPTMVCPKKVKK